MLRIKPTLEFHQTRDQAAFRKGFSTVDHLQTMNQVLEKCQEYQMTLYMAFIDFSKAFDSINHESIWIALNAQGLPGTYIKLLKTLYANTTTRIKTETIGEEIEIKRGVKQGDPLSPILFSAVLEDVFKKLNWHNRGINISGNFLNNLRFADDIVLFSHNHQELQNMLNELSLECCKVGLLPNVSKTKVMTNSIDHPITLNGNSLEYVEDYIYLGQLISFKSKEDKEIQRRITNGWKAFWAINDIMKMEIPQQLKKESFESSVISVLTYGSQTWSNPKRNMDKLSVCQRNMERSLLNIRLIHKIPNTTIKSLTGFKDSGKHALCLKWDWAGHIARMYDNRWTKLSTEWTPLDKNRRVGRQPKRWRDNIKNFCPQYNRIAHNRTEWKSLREAFSQKN